MFNIKSEYRKILQGFLRDFIRFIDLHHRGILILDDENNLLVANEQFYRIFDEAENKGGSLLKLLEKYDIKEDGFFYDAQHRQVNVAFSDFTLGTDFRIKCWLFETVEEDVIRRRLLESTVQYSHDGIEVIDLTGRMIIYNEAQGRIDKYKPEDVIGKHVRDIYELNNESSLLLRVLHTMCPMENVRQTYYTKTGNLVNAISSIAPLFNHGKMFGVAAIVRDYSTVLGLMEHSSREKGNTLKSLENGEKEEETRYQFDDIISQNTEMRRCIQSAKRVAANDSSVLIIGETGTGKEMFAQSIHNSSKRKGKRFVAINCAVIPENLLESLLFGTTKGAFTGAVNKKGLFEEVDGGTVFLDEVNSMPFFLQAKLLRVLEERQIMRIGSNRAIQVDFRLISSFNENPGEAIRENRIRADLFYRLAVHCVVIPSLRKRRDDIDILCRHFIGEFNTRFGKNIKGLDSEVQELVMTYDWPGNVRQLRHMLEAGVSLADRNEEYLTVRHLPKYLLNEAKQQSQEKRVPVQDFRSSDFLPDLGSGFVYGDEDENIEKNVPMEKEKSVTGSRLIEQLRENEKLEIIEAIKRNNGNVAKAARELGMSRQKLYYRIKKHGI